MNDSFKYIEFPCPFCEGKCTADGDTSSVTHTMPTCKKFDDSDPLEFIKAVNLVQANKRGVGIS
jgi:rRNA processing protein Krr1/Pno1